MLADGVLVGRIIKSPVPPPELPWFWTLLYGYHRGRTPTDGYAGTPEDAMPAFAKSWLRG